MIHRIALTHVPSPNMQLCERTFVAHSEINPRAALEQFNDYCNALRELGCDVRMLDVNSRFPDCCFIEDTAVILGDVAVVASMGAASRSGEPAGITDILREYGDLRYLPAGAMLEGGDVLRVGRTLLVGKSCRTNEAGIMALAELAEPLGYRVRSVAVHGCLHFKTACTALPDGRLLANPRWFDGSALPDLPLVRVPEAEPWGGNVLLIGERIIVPAAHRQTAEMLDQMGFLVRTVDLSEFAKAEAGATCLSLLLER